MKNKALHIILWLGCVVGVTYGALFEDDFESYVATSSLHGQGDWNVYSTSSSQTVVVASINSPLGDSGGQSLYFVDNDSSSLGSMVAVNSFLSQTQTVSVVFDLRCITKGENPMVVLRDASNQEAVKVVFAHAAGTYRVHYQDSTGSWIMVDNLQLVNNAWYRFSITADMVSDTFDMSILDSTGAEVGSVDGGSFRTNVEEVRKIVFTTNAGNGATGAKFNIDNLVVQEVGAVPPSPATIMASFGSGSLMITSTDLTPSAIHTLQTTTNLVAGIWSNLTSSSGSSSNTWTVTPLSDTERFYRIASE